MSLRVKCHMGHKWDEDNSKSRKFKCPACGSKICCVVEVRPKVIRLGNRQAESLAPVTLPKLKFMENSNVD